MYGDMDSYDRLPKAVRQALANSDHNWSGSQVYYERHRRVRKPQMRNAKAIVEFIKLADIKKHNQDAEAGLVCGGQR